MWPPMPPAAPPTRPPRPEAFVSEGVVAVFTALFVTFRPITPAKPPLAKPAPKPPPLPPPLAFTWVELLLCPPPKWWLEKFLNLLEAPGGYHGLRQHAASGVAYIAPRLAMKESIFCDPLRKPIAHMNQIRTLPDTASLPTASTCACTSSSETAAKAGWR